MITNIDNGILKVEQDGLTPGYYSVRNLTLDELVTERNKLHVKLLYDKKVEPTVGEITEMVYTENLISQLTELIVNKCMEIKP